MEPKSRKRGIKASREKLNAAMLNSGIKTQTSLAEKIATSENLEIAPKDTVNKAFREENVSPATIARIALALKVEADTLYLTEVEIQQQEISNTKLFTEQLTKSRVSIFKRYRTFLGLFIFTVLILTVHFTLNNAQSNQKAKYDISGHWIFKSDISGGVTGEGVLNKRIASYELAIQIIQTGQDIKGMYLGATNEMCGKANIEGKVIDNQINWKVEYIGCYNIKKTFKGHITETAGGLIIDGNTTPINTPNKERSWSGYEIFKGVKSISREPISQR